MIDTVTVGATAERVNQIVDNLTLFDDDLMSMVFDGNIPATELILRIILKQEDITVLRVTGQKELENPLVGGRNIKLDILAKDRSGKQYNLEVQRSSAGADERRARFHSSMMDSRMLKKGQDFKELLDSYMIFITEKDYFQCGLPIYTVKRYIEELDRFFEDGSHIIYVNGSYKGDDPVGKLMHDFSCKNAKDMYFPDLADGVKHFKEEGGRNRMCEAVEAYGRELAREAAKKAAIQADVKAGIAYGADREIIISRLCKEFDLSLEEAEQQYDAYAAVAV